MGKHILYMLFDMQSLYVNMITYVLKMPFPKGFYIILLKLMLQVEILYWELCDSAYGICWLFHSKLTSYAIVRTVKMCDV